MDDGPGGGDAEVSVKRPSNASGGVGEMDPDAKHAMSHRADAFAQLVKAVI